MANVNRWVEDDPRVILTTVASAVTVEIGDLMFLDDANNLRNHGSSTANYFAYPIAYLRTSGSSLELNKVELKDHFLGVAMDDKDGITDGSNMKIPIATSGKFKYGLKPARTVYIGNYVGASGSTTDSPMYNQKILNTTDSTKAIGYFAENKKYALDAELFIHTAYRNKI